ncbi:hypothetical protein CRE_20824 [Caenorhabditis remanei]|uniref:Uncharacterized protein n=1 Tax=Caenorhabditis remanei TaxID=31234 RepID=E3MUZ7_CAERE|nr:hypothetical protein CRE_20824 [Caenorhabditis remanei]
MAQVHFFPCYVNYGQFDTMLSNKETSQEAETSVVVMYHDKKVVKMQSKKVHFVSKPYNVSFKKSRILN